MSRRAAVPSFLKMVVRRSIIFRRPDGVYIHVAFFLIYVVTLLAFTNTWSKRAGVGSDPDFFGSDVSHRDTAISRLWGLEPFGVWPDYFDKLDVARLAPFTKDVQRWIYEKQHPPQKSCAEQKYYVLGTHKANLGSVIHVATFKLAVALEHGYQIVWHPDWHGAGGGFADPGCGRGDKFSNFLCYFEPPSSCGYEFVNEANSVFPLNWADNNLGMDRQDIPSYWVAQFQDKFPDMNVTPDFLKFWWRAQGAAYLMRLNAETRTMLLQLRLFKNVHQGFVLNGSQCLPVTVPFPLPPGTASIHVRHPDEVSKGMTVKPLREYTKKLESLASENPFFYKKVLFVTSEDAAVISDAQKLNISLWGAIPHNNWIVYYTNMTADAESTLESGSKTEKTLKMLLQLLTALECDAFLGTLGSDWNRLIAELRCIWIDSCNAPYIEVAGRKEWGGYKW